MVTIAFHKGGKAYFNKHKLERKKCSMVNTLVHEYMHFIGYSHGDNSPVGKENSVPYYFGNRAQELCEAGVI
jgi:prolyl-tRNA editing enzyme YbaK/EbsC (Cys-tRNA(Pro) deacylase)